MEIQNQNGEQISDPKLIQDEFWNFFMLKWKETEVSLSNWTEFANEDMVPQHLNTMLEVEVTDQEIQTAVFSLGNNQAPGMDGINSSFLKFYWEIIKGDVNHAILHFFSTNLMCEI